MPLIQIHLDQELFDSHGDQLSAAIHRAQVDSLDIPADDLFQIFSPHRPAELRFDPGYNGVDRRRLVLLQLTMVQMYDDATKKALFEAIVDRLAETGVRPEDVLISVVENSLDDWYAGRL